MRHLILAVLLAINPGINAFAEQGASGAVAKAESFYADFNDATAAVGVIESGYARSFGGKDLAQWKKVQTDSRNRLQSDLKKLSGNKLDAEDARAVKLMRAAIATSREHAPGKTLHCVDAKRSSLNYDDLRRALYACFEEVGNHLRFDGTTITRSGAFTRLESIDDAEQRKAVFQAMSPLYEAINGKNEPDSPYRRLIRQDAARNAKESSELAAAAGTVGANPAQVEQWLVEILETWRQVSGDDAIEPWDYRHGAGVASRQLESAIPLESLQVVNARYYRDLGVDLEKLGVIYDLDPRPGKEPVAYTDFARRGREVKGRWQPTIARVLANYSSGGLGNLNEFIHENGHAVQISAIHTRPAFMDWGDTVFVEAFADVSSWNTFDPAWQRKYLGQAASERENLRALYSAVMLDVAWALFEIRMLHDPLRDPNRVWTEITSRYLHIVPHPELSWWAVRGQLVDAPGYMVNYGLGAVITAELRARIRAEIGSFDTGNDRWYRWLSDNLLRFGAERETSELLRDFLGHPISPEPLLADIRRMAPIVESSGEP